MAPPETQRRPVAAPSLRVFFHGALGEACRSQRVEADDATIWYLADLLTRYARSDNLYEYTADGPTLRPLALLYALALEAQTERERRLVLQRLGDVALFIAGLFSGMLARRAVDVDYYIAMGGSAYSYLRDAASPHARERSLATVFEQLSSQFVLFVDVLSEVGEQAPGADDRDLLRAYELWMHSGSPRLARRLRERGISPVRVVGAH